MPRRRRSDGSIPGGISKSSAGRARPYNNLHVGTRYPDAHPESAPLEHYGPLQSDKPFERRALDFDATGLPVPAELLVYTQAEWRRLMGEAGRFARTLAAETVWVYERGA